MCADLKPEWQHHIVAAPEGRRQHHLRMLGAISCRGLPQTDASYARGYLLAAMLGHHSDTGMECPENSRTSVVKHSQTEGSSARSYLLAILLGPSLRLTLLSRTSAGHIPRPRPALLGAISWQLRSGHLSDSLGCALSRPMLALMRDGCPVRWRDAWRALALMRCGSGMA